MATIKTGVGGNNYASHIVGYESSRLRYETFKFTVPSTTSSNLPVINATLSSGKSNISSNFCRVGNGATLTVNFAIGSTFSNKTKYGTVTFSGDYPTLNFTKTCTLKPGSYNLYIYTASGTFGWRYFPSSSDDMYFSLTASYLSYSNCSAPDSSTINISPSIQAPGSKITISWGKGTAGTSNPITGYKVQYTLNNGSTWSEAYSSTTTSAAITLPSSASRGSSIKARVMTVGTVSGYNSSYSSSGGSGRVNNLPSVPTISVNKTLIPSTGATVTFTLTAGGIGTGDSDQSAKVYYATSSTGTKSECGSSFSPSVSATTTYYFWTYDGLEYSSSYASKTITVNTKPTVTLSVSGTQASNETATFTKGNDGQSNNNKYTFGFTYNNEDYTLSSAQTGVTYSIGDMRKQLSDKLGSLKDNTTYSYSFWVQRNDGIENSDKVSTTSRSLSVPLFTLKNDNNVAASFSRKVTATLSGTATGTYFSIGFEGAETKDMSLNTLALDWETKIDKLLVNNSFYVTPQTTLTKVKKIDITPSKGKTSPFSLSVFKTYTTQQLQISLMGSSGSEYGLTALPKLTLKYTNVSTNEFDAIELENNGDINTYNYSVDGVDIFRGIDINSSNIILTFEIKNDFEDSFSEDFELLLDHTEPAIPYTDESLKLDLYPGLVSGSTTKYPSLNQWEYLKESMPIYVDFSVLAFDEPTFIFEIYNYHNSGIWEEIISSIIINSEKTAITEYGEVLFNTYPTKYYIKEQELIEKINEITQDHNIKFRVTIKTNGQEAVYDFFNGDSLSVKAHYSPRAHFSKIEFKNSNLETQLIIDDQGYTDDGNITNINLKFQEYDSNLTQEPYDSSNSYTWKNFTGFKTEEKSYEFLHIAPVLYSTLSTSTTSYSKAFITNKETTNFTYTVTYNISPTVSYRKNYLGINTLEPKDSNIITIGESQDRYQIQYVGSEQHPNCKIISFQIDCGSW